MRQVFLDTETTGLEPKLGHRIIEIACLEMSQRRITGRHLHRYINPDRDIDEGALAVHGITREFLEDKPRFRDIVDELLEFVGGAELVIHNAAFDIGFLDHELALLGKTSIRSVCQGVVDTLRMARELHPGKRNNLDALCERYGIDNAHRTLHGALLDSELLAEVYLGMTRGQDSLISDADDGPSLTAISTSGQRGPIRIVRASAEEIECHEAHLNRVEKEHKGPCVWRKISATTEQAH